MSRQPEPACSAAAASAVVRAGGRRGGGWHRCGCGRPIPRPAKRRSSRTCPESAPTWARDTRRRLLENLRPLRSTVMFSVTAPGKDVYPFDPRFVRIAQSLLVPDGLAAASLPRLLARSTSAPASGGANCTGPRASARKTRPGTADGFARGCGRSRSADWRTFTACCRSERRLNSDGPRRTGCTTRNPSERAARVGVALRTHRGSATRSVGRTRRRVPSRSKARTTSRPVTGAAAASGGSRSTARRAGSEPARGVGSRAHVGAERRIFV